MNLHFNMLIIVVTEGLSLYEEVLFNEVGKI